MSDNLQPPNPKQGHDLLGDFRQILKLFDRENQIYKTQINILKDAVNILQQQEDTTIKNMRRELNDLRTTLGNLEQHFRLNPNQPSQSSSTTTSDATIPESNTPATHDPGRKLTDYLCQICLDAPRDCILEPCMHFCLCAGCVNKLAESKCPICRRPIEFYQNVFIS